MLGQDKHIVIGTVDIFDTETPVIIAANSLQGQALDKLFGGDLKELDAKLAAALSNKQIAGVIQKEGKQDKYGIGTVAAVKHAANLIFFLAYCKNTPMLKSPPSGWSRTSAVRPAGISQQRTRYGS